MSLTKRYLLTFTNTAAQCKLTYYNGQFKRLEYLRGGMALKFWSNLTKVIPFNESKIKEVEEAFNNRVKFEHIAETSPKSQFSLFQEVFIRFYNKQSNGLESKWTGIEGKALKQIITYLNKISATEAEALAVWKQVFTYWDRLDDFYKNQIQLRQINSNLNTILIQIKDGNSTRKNQSTAHNHANDLRQQI